MLRVEKPWGYYEDHVEGPGYKVKKLVVFPEKRLSMQRHKLRKEKWQVVEGVGRALFENGMLSEITVRIDGQELKEGSELFIKENNWHRLINTSNDTNLVVIEIQMGVCDENDIERLEDDFGRMQP